MRKGVDVLVLGGGVAGLAAAREISRAGLTATLLEARPRLGGRVLTWRDPLSPVPIELGAEFLHGETPGLFDLLRDAALAIDILPDRHVKGAGGRFKPFDGFWEDVERMLADIRRRTRRRDLSVADYLERAKPANRADLARFVEGFHAAPIERVSARSIAAGGDDRQFRLAGGYDGLTGWLRKTLDAELRLSTVVKRVRWGGGAVEVEADTAAGAPLDTFKARAAVVALPLGVLKSEDVRFEPALPSLEFLKVGHVFKIVLRFRRPFWSEETNFVHAPKAEVPVWWTPLPALSPILTGWAGGPRAERLLREPEAGRIDRSLGSVARVFGRPRREVDDLLDAAWTHDWSADPFSRGAYPYVGVGGLPALKALARPLRKTLYLAGDGLDPEGIGTVGAAWSTGVRAGRAVARNLGAPGVVR